jgi:phosphatidylinositol alpha 1,6-mannosyltransferase
VKLVLVAETFLPEMNGVVNSVLQMLRHLQGAGHETLLIAPGSPESPSIDEHLHGSDVALLRSIALPSYPGVRVTFATAGRLEAILRSFDPDVVHLASPFILGWQALRAADNLGIPTVAIYQTDIPGYAQRYGIPAAAPIFSQHLARIHGRATLTLAPSTSAISELESLGVERLKLWARGVDGERFTPAVRSETLRHSLFPDGGRIIGYVGRLAPEKQVEDLAAIADIPGTRLVIVGDGPSRVALEKLLPNAVFLGFQGGEALAETVASFDVFVHPGENETFCQTVQEALASGVPVVATGRGGPIDLVQSSRTGWLYRPGDLADLRARVLDLLGDEAKRVAFGRAARESVAHRTWASLGDELLGHYSSVAVGSKESSTRWERFVAVGDSLTEGLSDTSRQAEGVYRGWADRFAGFLAHSGGRVVPLRYANLAVRSRRISDVLDHQIPRAIELRADFVSVLVGANDLVRWNARPKHLAKRLSVGIDSLLEAGIDVLVIGVFAPRRRGLSGLHRKFARFNVALAQRMLPTAATMLDFSNDPACAEAKSWAEDRVHLSSHGHRALSYRVAAHVGLPEAAELGVLDAAVHNEPVGLLDVAIPTRQWLWVHVLPWMGRRLRGRTAGDGILAKRPELLPVIPVVAPATAGATAQRAASLPEVSLVDFSTK